MNTTVNTTSLKNIIFDLGDVIIPIDLSAPIRNFAMLANLSEEQARTIWEEHNLVNQYETGLVDDDGFRNHIRDLFKQDKNALDDWADQVIDTAWNTILLDLPLNRIERVKELSKKYRLFLLSNTSPIHIRQVNNVLMNMGEPTLEDIFERVFYSYQVRLAKPSPEIYQHVLTQADLVAEETMFLDDNAANIQSAATLGIQVVHVQAPKTILEYTADL